METPRGGRKAEGVKAGGSGKWEEKWRSERKKEKRAKIGYMEMGKSSKDRDKEVGRKNAGCQKIKIVQSFLLDCCQSQSDARFQTG